MVWTLVLTLKLLAPFQFAENLVNGHSDLLWAESSTVVVWVQDPAWTEWQPCNAVEASYPVPSDFAGVKYQTISHACVLEPLQR